ncbi:tetratricopeptide repeat protein [Candidatus Poribacteria bacterium]|nr:tetratricopeptide repeat protein [Candidatus Poribacteria bacterium]
MSRRILLILILAFGVILYGCSMKGAIFQNAENAFDRGDYAEAKKLYTEVIRKYPGSEFATKAKFRLAQICEKEYDWDNALKYYEQVTKEVKGGYLDAQSRSRMALIRKARQDIAKAKYIYDNNPGSERGNRAAAQALYDMAQAYERLGQYEKAIETYEKLLKEFPKYKNADQVQYQIGMIYFYKLYDYGKGWKAFMKVIKNYPDSDLAKASDRLLKKTQNTLNEIAALIEDVKKIRNEVAMKFEKMGRHVSQADKYSIHAEKAAQDYIGIAEGWKKLKNYPNAIKAYKELADEIPFGQWAPNALFNAAKLYQEMGDYEMAVKTYEELFKRYPHSFRRNDAIYNEAICYEAMREFAKAYDLYKTYISLDDTDENKLRRAEEKVAQWGYDEDGDGFPFYMEAQYGTSDKDPTSYPEKK